MRKTPHNNNSSNNNRNWNKNYNFQRTQCQTNPNACERDGASARVRGGESGTKKYTTHKIWNTLRLLSRSKWQRRRQRSRKILRVNCDAFFFFFCASARSRSNIFLIYAQPQKISTPLSVRECVREFVCVCA